MFSKSCEYGIRATIFVATQTSNNARVGIKEISGEIDSPIAFTAKILQKLVKNKIIKSAKGVGGGFEILKEDLKQITLAQIVIAIDGDSVFLKCGLGLSNCSEEHPCPFHDKFKHIKNDLRTSLQESTLEDLVKGIESGNTFLKNKKA